MTKTFLFCIVALSLTSCGSESLFARYVRKYDNYNVTATMPNNINNKNFKKLYRHNEHLHAPYQDAFISYLNIESDSSMVILSIPKHKDGDNTDIPVYADEYAIRRIGRYAWRIDSVINTNCGIKKEYPDYSGKIIERFLYGYAIGDCYFKDEEATNLKDRDILGDLFLKTVLDIQIYNYNKAVTLPYYFSDGADRTITISVISPTIFSVTFKGTGDNFFYELYYGSLSKGETGKLIYSTRSNRPNKDLIFPYYKNIVPPYSTERNITPETAFPVLAYQSFNRSEYIRIGDFILRQVDSSTHPENGSWLSRKLEYESDLPVFYRDLYRELKDGNTLPEGCKRLKPYKYNNQ